MCIYLILKFYFYILKYLVSMWLRIPTLTDYIICSGILFPFIPCFSCPLQSSLLCLILTFIEVYTHYIYINNAVLSCTTFQFPYKFHCIVSIASALDTCLTRSSYNHIVKLASPLFHKPKFPYRLLFCFWLSYMPANFTISWLPPGSTPHLEVSRLEIE